jgi:hypothetical protein
MINVDRQDFTICPPTVDPPCDLARNVTRFSGTVPGGFQYREELLGPSPWEIVTLNVWNDRTGTQEPTRT